MDCKFQLGINNLESKEMSYQSEDSSFPKDKALDLSFPIHHISVQRGKIYILMHPYLANMFQSGIKMQHHLCNKILQGREYLSQVMKGLII